MRSARVAVIGSGPSGIYAADELLRCPALQFRVDVFDRLPTPFGLVRYGVAPDHPQIKSIVDRLQRTLDDERVQFIGDVEFGRDFGRTDLLSHYDAVVYATGAAADRSLGVDGEDLPGSVSANAFVAWYSGHPDAARYFDLSMPSVAVIGAGNVALDVARVLTKSPEELALTDMPAEVVETLRRSKVREVHLIARRGPEHAKFTLKELRELCTLSGVEIVLDPATLDVDRDGLSRQAVGNLNFLRSLPTATQAGREGVRRIVLHFWSRPSEILGTTCVEGVRVLDDRGSDERDIAAQLVIRAVGYRSHPPADLPFDEVAGVVLHEGGRVVDSAGVVQPGEYVTGWVKRGPSGVVGTNKADSAETVAALVADLAGRDDASAEMPGLADDLRAQGASVISYAGWLEIDRAERELGGRRGVPRIKITSWDVLRDLGGVPAGTIDRGQ